MTRGLDRYASLTTVALTIATLVIAVTAWHPGSSQTGYQYSNVIALPVEVIGPTNFTTEVKFTLEDAVVADRLYLQIHSPGYKYGQGGKASIRVNQEDWIDVSNQTATCFFPESHYECIGGAFATVRFTLPAGGLTTGGNALAFRFNGTDGISSGYRVLDINVLDGEGNRLLPDSLFTYEDFSQWRAPINTEEAIAEGRRLWHEAELVDSPITADIKVRATCADCHTTSGFDLKYFNYSNHSIIQRSLFHNLTEEQGKQIASYIRSLDVEPYGTPWDPPYQPGPGTDDRPAAAWAAGAGLEWVLDKDEDAIPYMFPDGITEGAVSTDGTLNMREIPMAIQLPDWNEWLPRVHPLDAWDEVFEASESNRYFQEEVLPLANGGASPRQALRVMERWNKIFRTDRSGRLNAQYFGGYDSDGVVADYTLGLHQWQAVKTFEVMAEGQLQTSAPDLFGSDGEKLSWFGNSRSVFDVGPHISGPVQVGSYPHGSALQNIYMTTAWYELQLIVNAGNRNGLSIRPMDWKYHYGHIGDISKWSGIDEPIRYLKAYVKNMQEGTNSRCSVGSDCGFYLRHVTPARLVMVRSETQNKGNRGGRSASTRGRGSDKNLFDSMDPDLRRQLTEAVLRAHVKELLRHDSSEWARGSGRQALAGPEYVPTLRQGGRQFDLTSYADHYYRSIPFFKKVGVSTTLIDSLSTWGSTMWPAADWHQKNAD